MSLSWRRRLRAGICPDRLILGKETIGTDSPLDALSEALARHRKAQVTLVLANAFVRYALMPANPALTSDEQWLALARHRLASVLGEAADWDIRVADTGGARIAAAVPRSLLEELEARVDGVGASLVSVQPYLMAAFNSLRGRAPKGDWWLVVEEPQRLTLALVRDGGWAALRTRRTDERWRIVLPEILERESALLGFDSAAARVTVCVDGGFEETHEHLAIEAVEYRRCATAGA